MRIVINHNNYYKGALRILFESLLKTGFSDFDKIILVQANSNQEEPPIKKNLSEILPGLKEDIIFIQTKMNNFDYNGYHALYKYRSNSLVEDIGYLYLLDTVTFCRDFKERYKTICDVSVKPDQIISCPLPNSNICIFGREVISNYKDNFLRPISKSQAISLEHNNPVFFGDGFKMMGLPSFGNLFISGYRRYQGEEEIYKKGFSRYKVYYPYIGIFKWIGKSPRESLINDKSSSYIEYGEQYTDKKWF